MNTEPPSIQLAFPYSLCDRIKAAFVLIPQRRVNILLHSIIPLIGISVFMFALITGQAHGIALLILGACLLVTPLFTVLAVVVTYFSAPHAREPFKYSFDDDGIHVQSRRYAFTHKWEAILRVKRAGGFILFFFGPGVAHCLPVAAVQDARAEEALFALARRHGVATP